MTSAEIITYPTLQTMKPKLKPFIVPCARMAEILGLNARWCRSLQISRPFVRLAANWCLWRLDLIGLASGPPNKSLATSQQPVKKCFMRLSYHQFNNFSSEVFRENATPFIPNSINDSCRNHWPPWWSIPLKLMILLRSLVVQVMKAVGLVISLLPTHLMTSLMILSLPKQSVSMWQFS